MSEQQKEVINHNSMVNDTVLRQFSNVMGISLFNNFQNTCNIEQAISCASLFWPAVGEVDDCTFIKQFFNNFDMKKMREHFNSNRQEIERWVNTWSIIDLFLKSANQLSA